MTLVKTLKTETSTAAIFAHVHRRQLELHGFAVDSNGSVMIDRMTRDEMVDYHFCLVFGELLVRASGSFGTAASEAREEFEEALRTAMYMRGIFPAEQRRIEVAASDAATVVMYGARLGAQGTRPPEVLAKNHATYREILPVTLQDNLEFRKMLSGIQKKI